MCTLNDLGFLYHTLKFKFKHCNARFFNRSLPDTFYKDGFYCIPNFFSTDECHSLVTEIDRILIHHKDSVQVDSTQSDYRLSGADTVSQPIQAFWDHPTLRNHTQSYLGYQSFSPHVQGYTLAARLDFKPENAGSGGGWHRDTIYEKQFKAIVYLTDVNETHGPFQYISGTHTFQSKVDLIKHYGITHNQNRLTHDEVINISSTPKYTLHTLSGKAGTLILTDTSGIHRGKPIELGSRYALTNYYFQKSIFKQNAIPPNMQPELLAK